MWSLAHNARKATRRENSKTLSQLFPAWHTPSGREWQQHFFVQKIAICWTHLDRDAVSASFRLCVRFLLCVHFLPNKLHFKRSTNLIWHLVKCCFEQAISHVLKQKLVQFNECIPVYMHVCVREKNASQLASIAESLWKCLTGTSAIWYGKKRSRSKATSMRN